jgi:hypothetical protein
VARNIRRLRQQAPPRGPLLTDGSTAPGRENEQAGRARGTVAQGNRRKAYRPLPPDLRRAALEAGLEAYSRGDFFEAHELLEPAWMGTSNLAERYLYQGLIKLAAGYVHAVRGNPIGFARNLQGSRNYLATSLRLDPDLAIGAGIDLTDLLTRVDARLTAVAAIASEPVVARTPLIDLLPDAPQIR